MSSIFLKGRYSQIDKKPKIIIASNNSSLTQHLLVLGAGLFALHLLSFQQHQDVAAVIIYFNNQN